MKIIHVAARTWDRRAADEVIEKRWSNRLDDNPWISSTIPLASRYGCTLRASSARTMLNNELWTSIWPLYSMKPKWRNLFMK